MTAMLMADTEGEDSLFLSALLRGKPSDKHVLIWTMPDKVSRTFTDVDNTLACVRDLADELDVYIGVGVADEKVSAHRRFTANRVTGLFGLWADIDILDPNHKKTNLPETEAQALMLVNETGLEPTIVIHSGHGLQVWWLFNEMLPIITGEDNKRASEFVSRWMDALKRRARIHGWTIDATQDLARVLRVPGTTNRKDPKAIVPVRLLSYNDAARYDGFEDFEAAIESAPLDIFSGVGSVKPLAGMVMPEDVRTIAEKLVLNPKAEPPFDKWNALIAQNPNAARTFDHKRRDLKHLNPMDSTSEYDYALTILALNADEVWSDQEITNLLIAHRRKWARNERDLKLRSDYYARTILRARKQQAQDMAASFLGHLMNGMGDTITNDVLPEATNPAASTDAAAPTPVPTAPVSAPVVAAPRKTPLSAAEWARAMAGVRETDGDEDKPANNNLSAWATAFQQESDEEMDESEEEADGDEDEEAPAPRSFTPPADDDERRLRAAQFINPDATPERLIHTLSNLFQHFELLRVVRMVATPPLFGLEIRMNHTGEVLKIHLGDINGLMTQRNFIQTIAAYAGVVIPTRKAGEWNQMVASMLAIAENESIGTEATESGMLSTWLEAYVDRYSIDRDWTLDDGSGEPPTNGAFLYTGHVCVSTNSLLYWLRTDRMERMTPQNLGKMMRAIAAETVQVPFRKNGARSSRYAWRLSEEMSQRFLQLAYANESEPEEDMQG